MQSTNKDAKTEMTDNIIKFVWITVVVTWPVLKWICSFFTLYQFARMIYYWDTPGMYAGWMFTLCFFVFTGLTYFISAYKPKNCWLTND